MGNVVESVVKQELCSGCGVCAGVCPQGILSMKTLPNGDLAPCMIGHCVENCGICLKVCPFADGVYDPRQTNINLFGVPESAGSIFHENIGWYRRCFAGFSKVDNHRLSGASGGLLTWCLERLLKDGYVDKVAVVHFCQDEDKFDFKFYGVSSIKEIRDAAGSVYHPVEISKLIKEMISEQETRWAIVGVPCLCSAVRNASYRNKKIKRSVRYILGLACGMYQNTMYTEMLLKESGIPPNNVGGMTYRLKNEQGHPGNYGFLAIDRDRRKGEIVPYKGLPLYLGKNAYFRLNSCNYCKDVFAENADACFMDAWLPEYSSCPQGTSLLIIRNKFIHDLFSINNGSQLLIEDISTEKVVKSQSGQVNRKQQLINIRNLQEKGSLKQRFEWWLQFRTQNRSKHAWRIYGRNYGRVAFWLRMIDLVFLERTYYLLSRVYIRGKQMIQRS